jgi:hypothetical protein
MFISIEYRLEPDEFAQAMAAGFRRPFWSNLAFTVLFGLLFAGMIVVGLVRPPLNPLATAYLGACFLWGIYRLSTRRARLRKTYRKQNIIRMSAAFTEEGISWHAVTQNTEFRSDERWSAYERIAETPAFFLLHPDRKRAVVVPKRAFPPEQAALFSRFADQEFAQARLAPHTEPAQQA